MAPDLTGVIVHERDWKFKKILRNAGEKILFEEQFCQVENYRTAEEVDESGITYPQQ